MASARERTPSLRRIDLMCQRTVSTEKIARVSAYSWLAAMVFLPRGIDPQFLGTPALGVEAVLGPAVLLEPLIFEALRRCQRPSSLRTFFFSLPTTSAPRPRRRTVHCP